MFVNILIKLRIFYTYLLKYKLAYFQNLLIIYINTIEYLICILNKAYQARFGIG